MFFSAMVLVTVLFGLESVTVAVAAAAFGDVVTVAAVGDVVAVAVAGCATLLDSERFSVFSRFCSIPGLSLLDTTCFTGNTGLPLGCCCLAFSLNASGAFSDSYTEILI